MAVTLNTADGGGYASGASLGIVSKLRSKGIFARPLGDTVYLMLTPTTIPSTARKLVEALLTELSNRDKVLT